MRNIVESINDNILKSTDNIEEIVDIFSKIKGSTICVGSGGSKVVATFLSKVLSKKNNLLSNAFEPSSISGIIDNYENVFVCSYSGSNYGVKYSLNNKLNGYLFSNRKTKITSATLIHYDMDDEDSFISLGATIIPMAIALKYYLGDDFTYYIEDIFRKIDKRMLFDIGHHLNIFTDNVSDSARCFLESTLVEAGMSVPIINYKYDYCHGRSTINKAHDNSAILFSNDLDIDHILKEVIESTMKNSLIITSPYEDEVISDFYYTLQSLYLTINIADEMKIDLKEIDYDRIAVKSLYHFKGSM